jgi:hypothetical protein
MRDMEEVIRAIAQFGNALCLIDSVMRIKNRSY